MFWAKGKLLKLPASLRDGIIRRGEGAASAGVEFHARLDRGFVEEPLRSVALELSEDTAYTEILGKLDFQLVQGLVFGAIIYGPMKLDLGF